MSLINDEYINDLIKRINAIPDCKTLGTLMQEITVKFTLLMSMNTEIIRVMGILKTIPTNIGEVLTWVENVITSSFLGPYQKAILLEAELILDLAKLMQAIEAKTAGMSCQVPLVNTSVVASSPMGSVSLGG